MPDLDKLSSEVFLALQICATSEPLFPNMRSLDLRPSTGKSISFIPLLLSPRMTVLSIGGFGDEPPTTTIASMIASLPTLCPNLQEITLYPLPGDPQVAEALSGMLLASNRNALRRFCVDFPLKEAVLQVVCTLPNLRNLSVVIEKDSSPSVVLPNLTDLTVKWHDGDWSRVFRRATFGKLEAITLLPPFNQIDGFLEVFERAALSASIQNTLSIFWIHTSAYSWNPNYSSLLQFTQVTTLVIGFSCRGGCSSTVDDEIITNLARAMPKLDTLNLGGLPCCEIPVGVTAKGLVALSSHCLKLSSLCIHFQVDSLISLPAVSRTASGNRSAAPRRDCALIGLEVGEIPLPEESVSTVALTLARIFPYIEWIDCVDENWDKVADAISISREIISHSSEECPLFLPRSNFSDTLPGATPDDVVPL